MPPPLNAFFQIAPDGGRRLYLHHEPEGGMTPRGAVLYVHPWAEEMNKSRRMAALASRSLATDGWAVLQIDLLGCGDSSGDFGDATWQGWVDDVVRGAHWLQEQHPDVPLWLWGLRAGALLAIEALQQSAMPAHLLFWQPTLQGKAVLQGFLRLKAAAQLADGGGKGILQAARAALAAGQAVEVAGYTLSPALAQGLEIASLAPPAAPGPGARVVWLEAGTADDLELSPAAQAAMPRWEADGWTIHAQAVRAPAFWQTTEIEDAPTLVDATLAALRTAGAGPAGAAAPAAAQAVATP